MDYGYAALIEKYFEMWRLNQIFIMYLVRDQAKCYFKQFEKNAHWRLVKLCENMY